MTHCRRPFQDCASLCDRCAVPVYQLPPTVPPIRTKLAMICVTFVALVVLAVVAFAVPNAFERVTSAHQEDARV